VDQRLVRDRHLDRLDAYAAALYLFLITVADAQGLSWYGDSSTARRLSIDLARLRRARGDLLRAGLLAYARPLYQVLALDDPLRQPTTPPHAVASNEAAPRIVAREYFTALHTVLGKRA
jgi:hypothetical protein